MRFTDYQDVGDGMKNHLTDKQKGSIFWEKGKWDNYIIPHFPKKVKGLTYVDMGCSSGLFLKYAEDMGFERAVGVEINPEAVERGIKYREKVGGKWDILTGKMEEEIDNLPVSDYMTFINTHYYLLIHDWLELLDKLVMKTQYVVITTVRKNRYYCMASGRGWDVDSYFRNWQVESRIPQLPIKGDPCPRTLKTVCFRNLQMKRVELSRLKRGAHVKADFHVEIDKGKHPLRTNYFRRLKLTHASRPREALEKKMYDKVAMFEDVKKFGVKKPLIVNKDMRILDGNHRAKILEYLGYRTVLVRVV